MDRRTERGPPEHRVRQSLRLAMIHGIGDLSLRGPGACRSADRAIRRQPRSGRRRTLPCRTILARCSMTSRSSATPSARDVSMSRPSTSAMSACGSGERGRPAPSQFPAELGAEQIDRALCGRARRRELHADQRDDAGAVARVAGDHGLRQQVGSPPARHGRASGRGGRAGCRPGGAEPETPRWPPRETHRWRLAGARVSPAASVVSD